MFYKCTNLKNVTLSNNITSIGEWAFSTCTNLEKIVLPKSITFIDNYAFYGCEKLTKVEVPKNVTTITLKSNTFGLCENAKVYIYNKNIVETLEKNNINYVLILKGDVNGDGKVNGKDWNMMYEYINETSELTEEEFERADINEDGKVNGKDWNRLYEHINETNPLW